MHVLGSMHGAVRRVKPIRNALCVTLALFRNSLLKMLMNYWHEVVMYITASASARNSQYQLKPLLICKSLTAVCHTICRSQTLDGRSPTYFSSVTDSVALLDAWR